jgi:hypothetical protein
LYTPRPVSSREIAVARNLAGSVTNRRTNWGSGLRQAERRLRT